MKRYWFLLRTPKVAVMVTGLMAAAALTVFLAVLSVQKKLAQNTERESVHEYTVITEEPVQFEIQSAKSYAHAVGFKQVKQAGAVGSKQVTHSVKVKGDGTEVAKNKVAEQITNQPVVQIEIVGARLPNALTKAKSAQQFTASKGISHRETYYDLPMNVAINACGGGGYTVRADGAKVDKDGYILVAANYGNYPRCSVVETSMGPGKVYDTGGFAARHPHGFDLATDWTNGDGR